MQPTKSLTLLQKIGFLVVVLFTLVLVGIVIVKGRQGHAGKTHDPGLFGIQAKSRDTERETDTKALQGQLEAYYAQNGYYPTLANLNDTSWVAQNLKGLDRESLRDPTGSSYSLASSPTANTYAYKAVTLNGGSCDKTPSDCQKFTLTATPELTTTPIVINSLN